MPAGGPQGDKAPDVEGSQRTKMKGRMSGLKPLNIPKREMSYTLALNASGLSAFTYSARGPDGALTEHVLAESGDKGFSLGVIDIGPELGHGQGGRVRLSRHRQKDERYAVKEVNIVNEQTRHQVKRELGVYSSFDGNHPNIVALYDAFYTEGRVYMVLELMTWGSLELALLKNRENYLSSRKDDMKAGLAETATKKLDAHAGAGDADSVPAQRPQQASGRRAWAMEEAVLMGAASKILRALSFLHKEHSVVHRDIKPGNVMLSRDGSVKLTDFGVSLRGLESTSAVQAGTLGYMSLERLEGKICTERGDIWSFGIMLLECAKGRHPLIPDSWRVDGEEVDGEAPIQRVKSGENPAHWTECDVQHKVVELCSIPSPACGLAYSPDSESLISRCLSKDEEYRPDADELLQMPILAQHEACQQETMCKWLTQVGDPRACNDEGDEPVFKNWNHNPKIPLLTPRAADCGKPEPSPSTSISTGDAGRVPDDEASRGDEGSDRKRAKTTTECTSRSSV